MPVQLNVIETPNPATTFVGAWGSARTSGNYGVFPVGINENDGIVNITAHPTGWDILVAKYNPGGAHQSVVIYGRELDGTADDIPSLTISAARHMIGFLGEWPNVDHLAVPDAVITNGNASTIDTWSTGATPATTVAEAIALGFFAAKDNRQVASNPTNGFSIIAQDATSQGSADNIVDAVHGVLVEKTLLVTGTQECTVTSNLFRRYAAAMIVLPLEAGATPDIGHRYWTSSGWSEVSTPHFKTSAGWT